MDDTMEGRTS